jgi:hypothetical protein
LSLLEGGGFVREVLGGDPMEANSSTSDGSRGRSSTPRGLESQRLGGGS